MVGRMDENTPHLGPAAAPTQPTHETLPYGLKVFAEGTDPVLDIVAVHGLNGHRDKTWIVNGVNWLRDFLPSDIPNARILTWGYDANIHSASQISAQNLYDHAKTLVSDLCLKRSLTKTRRRPIVFVAHSLGGILVKSALIHSDAARPGALEEHRSIKLSTYGIFFMGTPHQGGGVHLPELMLKVASIFMSADDKILKHLERDSEWLQQQLGQYGPISREFVTKFAYEMYPTPTALGKKIIVVPHALAIMPGVADGEPVAIPADHLNMVKFTLREDGGYEKVSGHLRLLVEEAPAAINTRWAEQDRTREALSKITEDFSVPFSLSGVPEVEQFVGRNRELIEIKEAFQGDGSHRRTVILQGLGGIGKTQLAVTFVKQQKDACSAVFWLNGKNEDTLKQSFTDVAQRLYKSHSSSVLLRTAAESKEPDQVVDVVKQWLSAKSNVRWMLVFDNIDNPKLPGIKDPQAYDIKSYFPEAHQGFILITTRSSRLKVGKVIHVKKLQNVRESIEIIAHMSERQISDQDPHAVELAEKLDGLPLALATAGAYLCQVSTSLADYLLHYRSSWLELHKSTPDLYSYEDRALYSTWNISYKHICSQNESAGKLLQLWGYFDNEDLWYELLAKGEDDSPKWFLKIIEKKISFDVAVRLLCDHALIESNGFSGGYGMHGCVHAWIMHALNSERDISMADVALQCVGSAVPGEIDSEYWVLQQRLLPHANRCLESTHTCSLFGSKNANHSLKSAHNLGKLYFDQSKMKEAEEMYLWALRGIEMASGAEHMSMLNIVNSLGNLYLDQGRSKKAKEMYQRALKGYEKAFGAGNRFTFDIAFNNLRNLYLHQRKIKEAEEMYLRALTGSEKAWGVEHMSTLHTVNNLGILYRTQGKTKETEHKAWGAEHMMTLLTVDNLGILYSYQGKMKEAEEMHLRALTGYEKTLGAEHTTTLRTVNSLGILYSSQNKVQEAEEMYLRALAGYEKVWGAEHKLMLGTVKNLALLYSDHGKIKEAEDVYMRALTKCERVWGAEHKSTLDTLVYLGCFYNMQGKMKEAEEIYLRVLAGYEKVWGGEHTLTLDTVNNLGILYTQQGKMKEAEYMCLRALAGYEKAWGAENTSTLHAVHNLRRLYSHQGQMKEAEDMYLRALAGYEKALSPEHSLPLKTRYILALRYERKTQIQDAIKQLELVMQDFANPEGPDRCKTVQALALLKSCRTDLILSERLAPVLLEDG